MSILFTLRTMLVVILGIGLSSQAYCADRRLQRGRIFSQPAQRYTTQPAAHAAPQAQESTANRPPASPQHNHEQEQLTNLEFSYRYAINHPHQDKVVMKLHINDPKLIEQKESLEAEIEFANLRRERDKNKRTVPITWDEEGNAYLELDGLPPESVFQLKVALYQKSPQNDSNSNDSKRDRRKPLATTQDYHAVTSGESPSAKARFKVVTTALLEAADWKVGRKGLHNFPYPNYKGGWCGGFQQFCTAPFLKIFGEAPIYPKRTNGQSIPQMAQSKTPLHGSHGYIFAHKLMILEYSEDTNRVHTIEGNFSNRVTIHRRLPGAIHTVGQITDDFVWKENVAQP